MKAHTLSRHRPALKGFSVALLLAASCGVEPPAETSEVTQRLVAAAARVQSTYTTPQGSFTSAQVTFPQAQTAGNMNIVVVGWNNGTSRVTSVADTQGNVYTKVPGTVRGGGLSQAMYYAPSIKAGTNRITATFDTSAPYPEIQASEFSGLASSSPLDGYARSSGSGTVASSGSFTTTATNGLIFAAGTTTTGFTGAGAGYNLISITSPNSDMSEYRLPGAPGTFNATAPLSGGNWVFQAVGFKPRVEDTTGPGWHNSAFAAQTGAFTAEFDAVPSLTNGDVVIGLSQGVAAAYTDLAAIVRFGTDAHIDARNGGGYSALSTINVVAGTSYHFRMLVDVPSRKYSVYTTPQGQAETLLARDFAFRDSQSAVTSLANRGNFGDPGSVAISNFTVTAPPPAPAPTPTTPPAPTGTTSPPTTPPPPPTGDGSANAPSCTIQYPTLLDSYAVSRRPTWKVAGVNYCVGYPSSLTLKNPATISMAGVSVNATAKTIMITGNNVTLDGYNFSGWEVVTAAANTTLIRSNFDGLNPGGPQTSVISGSPSSSNLYVGYSVIDGRSNGGHAEFLVEMEGPGLTIEYSWLKNTNSDLIGRHGQSGGEINIRYNFTEQSGMAPGTHGDYLQIYGPWLDKVTVIYNTSHQVGGSTQGWIVDNPKTGEIGNNVLIGTASAWTSVGTDYLTSTFTTHDNYFVIGGYFFNYPATGPGDSYPLTVFLHNVDMVTGEIVSD